MKKLTFDNSKIAFYSDTTQQIIYDVVDGVNNGDYEDIDEAINNVLDNSLIYYDDQWDLLKDFCVPSNASLDVAIDDLTKLIYSLVND